MHLRRLSRPPSDAYLRVVPRGARRGRRPRQECPAAASCLHRGRYAAISMASFITVFIDICGTFSPTLSNFSKTVTSSLRECFSVTEDSAANWRRDASSLPAGARSPPPPRARPRRALTPETPTAVPSPGAPQPSDFRFYFMGEENHVNCLVRLNSATRCQEGTASCDRSPLSSILFMCPDDLDIVNS